MEGYSEEEGYYKYRHAPTVKPIITEVIPKRDTTLIIFPVFQTLTSKWFLTLGLLSPF